LAVLETFNPRLSYFAGGYKVFADRFTIIAPILPNILVMVIVTSCSACHTFVVFTLVAFCL
jgi:hypothetical protein